MKKLNLLHKLILGIIFGIIIGLVCKTTQTYVVIKTLSTLGGIFGNFLKFLIPCIIVGFVAPGIGELGKKAGKLLSITTALAYISTIIAGSLAYFVGKNILPKIIQPAKIAENKGFNLDAYFAIDIPPVMGVMTALVLAFMLGLGMAMIKNKNLFSIMTDFQEIVEKVVKNAIIPIMPFYIASIFAKIAASGEMFRIIKAFASMYICILILQASYVLIQYLITGKITKRNPFVAIKNTLPAYFTAVGTQSSAASIPVALECARKNNVSEEIVDFVIPLCATIHLAGDTITLVLGAMGILMLDGVNISFSMMMPYILMLGVTMVAAPGIPGGGVMAALGILQSMLGFTNPQQALMIALHFSQDSFGTATNVIGDGCVAMLIDEVHKNEVEKSSQLKVVM